MQRRLLAGCVTLAAVLIMVFRIPLAIDDATHRCRHLWMDRLHDTRHLAETAPMLVGQGRADVYARYRAEDRRRGIAVIVTDRHGRIVDATHRLRPAVDREVGRQLTVARRGAQARGPMASRCPALPDRLIVAVPARSHGQVVGAVSTVSSGRQLRDEIVDGSLFLLAGSFIALVVAALAMLPVVRWILRPVWQLGHAVREITNGHYGVRALDRSGPAEIRDLAAAFNTMTDRLTASLEAQRAFAADASHQLRNPLSGVRLRIESLEPHVAPAGREQLARAIVEMRRLSLVIDQLQQLARAEGGSLPTGPVDVVTVLECRADAWSEQAERDGVRLEVRGDQVVAVCADGALDQIVDVLLDNALRVSPEGATVTLRASASGAEHVEVHVVDEGAGMSPEDRARACDRFWRAAEQPPERAAGSGLGLAIAKALTTAGGGELRLDEASPHGIDAVVTLRRERDG
jgi:signal transduction histidine kinase